MVCGTTVVIICQVAQDGVQEQQFTINWQIEGIRLCVLTHEGALQHLQT